MGAFNQRVTQRQDAFGDALQELRAGFQRRGTIGVKGGAGQLSGARDVVRRARGEGGLQAFAGGGVDGVLRRARAQDGAFADQHLAGQGHDEFSEKKTAPGRGRRCTVDAALNVSHRTTRNTQISR
ncbi:hypothetical protein D3C73_1441430 [compost metagenome]